VIRITLISVLSLTCRELKLAPPVCTGGRHRIEERLQAALIHGAGLCRSRIAPDTTGRGCTPAPTSRSHRVYTLAPPPTPIRATGHRDPATPGPSVRRSRRVLPNLGELQAPCFQRQIDAIAKRPGRARARREWYTLPS